jgi:hypothetical protein
LIGVSLESTGVSIADNSRTPRLFRIVSGTNPYTAVEVQLSETDGERQTTGVYDVTAESKTLWEVNGDTTVEAGRVVVGIPNPVGLGFYFDADGLVSASGASGPTLPGTLFGFDVTDLQCIDGVLWVIKRPAYWDRLGGVTYGSAYYSHTAGCCDCPASSGSGGTSPPPPPPPPSGGTGGTASCCGRALSSTLYATLDGGNGTITLNWDGTYWSGSKALTCGETLYLRYSTGCGLDYSCNGTVYAPVPAVNPTIDCGPPFTHKATFACDMNSVALGCVAGSCGTVNVTEIGE